MLEAAQPPPKHMEDHRTNAKKQSVFRVSCRPRKSRASAKKKKKNYVVLRIALQVRVICTCKHVYLLQ